MHSQLRRKLLIVIFLFLPALLACQLFSGAAMLSGGQQMGGNGVLQSITLGADQTSIQVGGSATCGAAGAGVACFAATGNYANGNSQDITLSGGQLTSSNTAVLTVGNQADPWPTNAVAGGTSNVTFTYGGITSNSITVTVAVTVTITTSNLPNAATGVAYSQSLTASGGTAPYTWACTAGCTGTGPYTITGSGLSMATTGAITGTPAVGNVGTYNFSVQATDSASHTSPVKAFTVSVVNTAGCGSSASPPYPCSTHSTANAGSVTLPNVGGTTGTNTVVHAYPDAANSNFYQPTSGTGNDITRMTDANTYNGYSCAATISGGSNEIDFDLSGSYQKIYCVAGNPNVITVIPLGLSGGQLINGAAGGGNLAVNSVTLSKSGQASTLTNARFWGLTTATGQINLVPQDLSISSGSANAGTAVVSKVVGAPVINWLNAPGIPNPFPVSNGGLPVSYTEMTNSSGDTVFNYGMGDGTFNGVACTGQGCTRWLVTACVNGPCPNGGTTGQLATLDVQTGNYWAYCTPGSGAGQCGTFQNSTNPTGVVTQMCPSSTTTSGGMHNANMMRDPAYVRFASQCGSPNWEHLWKIGTNQAAVDPNIAGHSGNGFFGQFMGVGYNVVSTGIGQVNTAQMFAQCGPGSNCSTVAGAAPLIVNFFWKWPQALLQPGDVHGLSSPFLGAGGNDNIPFFLSSANGGGSGSYASADEIFAIYPNCNVGSFGSCSNTSGIWSRFVPTYSNFNLANTYFSAKYAVGNVSQNSNGPGGTKWAQTSNWTQSNTSTVLGTDPGGNPRNDVFDLSNIQ